MKERVASTEDDFPAWPLWQVSTRTPLTRREEQILYQILAGLTDKETARLMGLSYRTVEAHRSKILRKTNARNTAVLIRLALQGEAGRHGPVLPSEFPK